MKVGDVVTFKSGSPRMTVIDERTGPRLHLGWFDAHGQFQTQWLDADLLVVEEDPKFRVTFYDTPRPRPTFPFPRD